MSALRKSTKKFTATVLKIKITQIFKNKIAFDGDKGSAEN